jgi:putative Mg2+ transporter-C (MgtC) family protein
MQFRLPPMPLSVYEQAEALLMVVGAAILGGLIGTEREWRSKPAGIRTHILVAVSAALVVILGPPLVELYSIGAPRETIRNEPLSILHAIILGISFIGAGAVLKNVEAKEILNLTTAATLLFAGTVGVLVGTKLYPLAVASTLLILFLNVALQFLEKKMPRE